MKPDPSFYVRSPKKGFTVIEVMVSLSILTLTLIAIYQSFGVSLFVLSSTENLWKAMSYTQNELHRWERSFDSKVSVAQGEFEEKDPMYGFRWERKISDISPLPGVTVREVEFHLFWKERDHDYSYDAKIYIKPNDS